jgi:hypothetical protein
MPPTTSTWANALKTIDKSRKLPGASGGYIFLDPGTIVGIQSVERRNLFLSNWLLYRHPFILRIASAQGTAIPSEVWRQMLALKHDLVSQEQTGKAGDARNMLRGFFEEAYVEFTLSPPTTVIWRAQQRPLSDLEDTGLIKEILWEMYELNVRQELSALDRRAKLNLSSSFPNAGLNHECLRRCFPLRGAAPFLTVNFDDSDKGLAAASLENRAPHLIALKSLMLSWKGNERLADIADVTQSGQVTEEVEKKLIEFYVQSFFDHFGRPPLLPHRLDRE